ncbi:phosphoribosyltransferase-like protein [Sphingobacterium yanglingense]|uniref:PRTase-CE domain-containing protein n=1 Tax=Sphingobacterium yanglingense TaxID=1437280 RepID=A0A4R6WLW6_9SPHI|nr:hypothetical protein [Sphingobacterium yanglingense]TDQ79762.1 hypothetical protein CLV99_1210 [Sphingobacterium yanglingense]
MRGKATSIAEVLADYENNAMTTDHVLDWVSQFNEDDQEFVLDELLHIFKQTYLSKTECRKFIQSCLENWTKEFKYKDVASFIAETAFLDLQPEHKSQRELLNLLDEILIEHHDCNLTQSARRIKRYIYLDDVLSTGSKLFYDLDTWFKSSNNFNPAISNFQSIRDTKSPVLVVVICGHTWGADNAEFRLIKSVGTEIKKILAIKAWYWIENNIRGYKQKLNNMIPLDHQDSYVHDYWNSLTATDKVEYAFRSPQKPVEEELFSSAASRNRIETLFLVKGIEILSRVGELKVGQIRPLGYTIKSHKTFGLGTLFFTYRNIPNNCPIVFWWANNKWRPLFVLKNRGVKKDENG